MLDGGVAGALYGDDVGAQWQLEEAGIVRRPTPHRDSRVGRIGCDLDRADQDRLGGVEELGEFGRHEAAVPDEGRLVGEQRVQTLFDSFGVAEVEVDLGPKEVSVRHQSMDLFRRVFDDAVLFDLGKKGVEEGPGIRLVAGIENFLGFDVLGDDLFPDIGLR